MATAGFKLDTGYITEAGKKPINEDMAAISLPQEFYLEQVKGCSFAVADGVSTAEAGQEASRTAVQRFFEEYYKTPDTWSVSHSGQQVLSAINLRLYRKSHEFKQETKGYLSTFSAVVLKGHQGHFFHVGDTRIYFLRGEQLKQLTQDHTAVVGHGAPLLARAVGMDNLLHIDYGCFALMEGDILLLTSDGVHDFVATKNIIRILMGDSSAEVMCNELIAAAKDANSDDNLSCVVVKILALPEQSIDDFNAELTRLPFPPALKPGMKLDGYRVIEELFASSRSQLYLVEDEHSGERYVMKTPSQNYADDSHYIDRFIREQWIGSRIDSPHVVRIIGHNRPRTALYYLMEKVEGVSLDTWQQSQSQLKPGKAIEIIKQIADGLQVFHQNEAVHQDLKPGNIMVDNNDRVKIVDFGSVFVAGIAELYRPLEHQGVLGTASYSDPYYLQGKNPGVQGDVYSLATICYELFTGHLPYGDKIETCRTSQDYDRLRYHSARKYNPVIPLWFDRALEKGVKINPADRYLNIAEFMADLTHPNPLFLKEDPEVKGAGTLLFWKLLSGFWFITFLLVVYLFSQSRD